MPRETLSTLNFARPVTEFYKFARGARERRRERDRKKDRFIYFPKHARERKSADTGKILFPGQRAAGAKFEIQSRTREIERRVGCLPMRASVCCIQGVRDRRWNFVYGGGIFMADGGSGI